MLSIYLGDDQMKYLIIDFLTCLVFIIAAVLGIFGGRGG